MSKRRNVLAALKALVELALPYARVQGFEADEDPVKPDRADPGGDVLGYPGSPGEPAKARVIRVGRTVALHVECESLTQCGVASRVLSERVQLCRAIHLILQEHPQSVVLIGCAKVERAVAEEIQAEDGLVVVAPAVCRQGE